MTELQVQQAKDQGAREAGFQSWADMIRSQGHEPLAMLKYGRFKQAIDGAIRAAGQAPQQKPITHTKNTLEL